MFKSLCLLVGLLLGANAFAVSPDPLFQNMEGHWTGKGKRVFMISGQEIELTTEVNAVVTDGRLFSENNWTEIDPRNPAKPWNYVRKYWIAPGATPGEYDFGYGNSDKVGAHGYLSGSDFLFKQAAGTIVIESKTVFSENRSTYFETIWNGDTKISETTVEYTRAPAN